MSQKELLRYQQTLLAGHLLVLKHSIARGVPGKRLIGSRTGTGITILALVTRAIGPYEYGAFILSRGRYGNDLIIV